MRLYTFTNFMLSSIQQGIQPLHVTSELMLAGHPLTLEWARNYKTVICLNGGNNAMLTEVYDELTHWASVLDLPVAKFHEDDQSLGGIMTSVGVIIPTHMYQQFDMYKRDALYTPALLDGEFQLMSKVISNKGLAK